MGQHLSHSQFDSLVNIGSDPRENLPFSSVFWPFLDQEWQMVSLRKQAGYMTSGEMRVKIDVVQMVVIWLAKKQNWSFNTNILDF